MESLQTPQAVDQVQSNASEIAAFKSRLNKRRPTVANQYRLLAQRRRRASSVKPGAPEYTGQRRQSQQPNDDSSNYRELPPITTNEAFEQNYPPETMESSHAYEAHTINWKEAQEEKALKERQQKVLQSAGPFRRHMYALTESMFFNGIILVVILLNTAVLCALTFNVVVVRAGNYQIIALLYQLLQNHIHRLRSIGVPSRHR